MNMKPNNRLQSNNILYIVAGWQSPALPQLNFFFSNLSTLLKKKKRICRNKYTFFLHFITD